MLPPDTLHRVRASPWSMGATDKRSAPKWIPKDPTSKEQARRQLRNRCLERIEGERSLKRNASVTRSREMWLYDMVQQEVMNLCHNWSEEVCRPIFTQEIGLIIREEYHHAMNVYEQRCNAEMGQLSLDQLLAIEEEIAKETTSA